MFRESIDTPKRGERRTRTRESKRPQMAALTSGSSRKSRASFQSWADGRTQRKRTRALTKLRGL